MKKFILLTLITVCYITNSYAQEQLHINTEKSELKWSSDYLFHFGGHYGFVSFKEGHFVKTNGKITDGEFIIDLNTITCTDIEHEKRSESLVNHLKNEDFFNVKSHPTARLTIDYTQYDDDTHLTIFAYLTIKDITMPIEFQAEINYEKLYMTTKFKIDRTLWNINYNSKSVLGDMKNNAISDAIAFEAKLSL